MPEEDEEPPAPTPCAGCRTLRRRCVPGCVFAPYFPAGGDDDDPSRFAVVHRVFGASNAARMLGDVVTAPEDRRRAAETLVEEARARVRDPALGCVSYVAILQMLNEKAREQVDAVRAEIAAEFGAAAADEPVDVAVADPAAKEEARAQAERALANARKKDAELLAARQAADLRWLQQHRQAKKHAAGGRNTNKQVAGAENTAAAAASASAGESSSEQTMLMPQTEAGTELDSPEGNVHPRQQMAETEEPAPAAVAARERGTLTPPAAAADQGRHLAAPHAGTEPGIPGLGQLHQEILEDKQSSTAVAEAARDEAVASWKAPAAAPPHHDSAATQLAGAGTGFLDMDQRAAAEALAKNLDTMIHRSAAAQQQHHPPAAHYASMGLDVSPQLQHPPHQLAAAAAGVASDQNLAMLAQQIAEVEAAAEKNIMMQLLAAGAPHYGNLAAQYDVDEKLDVTLVHGHQDMRQQMTEAEVAAAELAGEEMIPLAAGAQPRHRNRPVAQAQYAQTELGITLGLGQQMMQTHQLPAAAKVAGEQETIIHQVAAAEVAREQEMTLLLQTAAQQDPVAEYSETELGTSLGQGHPYRQMLLEQLLSGAEGVAGVPNTTVEQHVAAYTDGEHGNGSSGATAAFWPRGRGEAAPFLVEQGPPPQGQAATALGIQMDSSSLPSPLPSLEQTTDAAAMTASLQI